MKNPNTKPHMSPDQHLKLIFTGRDLLGLLFIPEEDLPVRLLPPAQSDVSFYALVLQLLFELKHTKSAFLNII